MSGVTNVLDYARPTTPRSWRWMARLVVLGAVYAAVGALVGWTIAPPTVFTSTGMFEVPPKVLDRSRTEVRSAFTMQVQRNVSAVSSSENVQSASQALADRGITISPAAISAALRVENPKSSNLVSVSFTHRDPATAAAVMNELLRRFPLPPVDPAGTPPLTAEQERTWGNGIRIINDGSPAVGVSHAWSFTLYGMMGGMLVFLIVLWHRRGRV